MGIEEQIAVMTAYKEGKRIECRMNNERYHDNWTEISNPKWNWSDMDYRVIPEPTYRPFNDAEEVMSAIKNHGDWIKRKEDSVYFKIVCVDGTVLRYGQTQNGYASQVFERFTFADGTPFGVKEA